MAQILSLFERADQYHQASLKLAYCSEDEPQIAAASHNLGTLRKEGPVR